VSDKTKTIKIGLDLDGVLARHSLSGFWFRIRKAKEEALRNLGSSSYYYPKTFLERWAWMMIDWFRRPLAKKERDLLIGFANVQNIQFFLITGRFGFLKQLTLKWLRKNNLFSCFDKIAINVDDGDPTLFKARSISKFTIDCFVDDDLEVLKKLTKISSAKLYWLVPQYRDKRENGHPQIRSVTNLTQVFREVISGE